MKALTLLVAVALAGCSSGGSSSSASSGAGTTSSSTSASATGSTGNTQGSGSSSAASTSTGAASASTGSASASTGAASASTTASSGGSTTTGASSTTGSTGTTAGGSSGSTSTSGCGTSQIIGTWAGAAPGRACTDGGWCQYEQTGAFSTHSAAIFGPSDAWAMDDDGVLWSYDGARWNPVSRTEDSTGPRTPIDGTSQTDLWAASQTGGLLNHYDGTRWTQYQLGQFIGANQFYAASPTDVYLAAGFQGVFHFDGCSWSALSLPQNVSYAVSAISGSGSSDVWALGTQPGGGNEQALHWDGTSWSELDTGNAIHATAIFAFGPGDVWLGGTDESGATPGALEHYDGTAWTLASLPSAAAWSNFTQTQINALWGSGPHDLWAFGDAFGNPGVILHYDGAAWTLRTDAPALDAAHSVYRSFDFRAAGGSGPSDAWAMGIFGAIAHFDGAAWTSHRNSSFEHLAGVYAGGSDEAFAAGSNGSQAGIDRWDGRAWHTDRQFVDSDGGGVYFLNGISGWANDDVWAVGVYERGDPAFNGSAFATHWDGTQWTDTLNFQFLIPNVTTGVHSPQLQAVSAHAADDAWAVGEDGATLQWAGGGWESISNPLWDPPNNHFWDSGKFLRGVANLGAYAWAVGDQQNFPDGGMGPTMLVWAGGAWALDGTLPIDPVLEQFGSPPILFAVWASSPEDVWAVGASIYHRDVNGWQLVPTTGMSSCGTMLAVGGNGLGDVFVGCEFQVVERWNGATWDEEFLPYEPGGAPSLHAFAFDPDGGFWAVGENGDVYQHP